MRSELRRPLDTSANLFIRINLYSSESSTALKKPLFDLDSGERELLTVFIFCLVGVSPLLTRFPLELLNTVYTDVSIGVKCGHFIYFSFSLNIFM